MVRGFPRILSKALVRKDLLKCTQDYRISENYLKYPELTEALKAYQRVSGHARNNAISIVILVHLAES